MSVEDVRLGEARENRVPWHKWGPYLSERQWGTVREDYSSNGDAWNYFTHDQARSRAYRWGEDGIAGISDDKQRLCFAVALWNGKDPILKERLFGLTNSEGNHGEDVKEYYFYLDNTPTHSYMKYLYKYPQAAYPYLDLVQTNKARTRFDYEYELIDTGIFDEDRYFDVFVEYAKESPEEILIQITVYNRGKDAATLQVLPTLWFRNTWANSHTAKPNLEEMPNLPEISVIEASDAILGKKYLYTDGEAPLLFTENETNNQRLFGTPNASSYVKDGINNYIVNGEKAAVNPQRTGTKAVAQFRLTVAGGGKETVRLRLSSIAPDVMKRNQEEYGLCLFADQFSFVLGERKREADEFYSHINPTSLTEDERRVFRQALSGMLWSKQYYNYNVAEWLREHNVNFYQVDQDFRNIQWYHMANDDIISMPDKWEYPWYAAWDLAFQAGTLSLVDADFAKQQLKLMLIARYMHPNGQIPAYEWNFGDVNPPVHAFAALFKYLLGRHLDDEKDIPFLEDVFQNLLLNFTWWVNRKDPSDYNVFQGGFLGLDNIGVFDRSAKLPQGVTLEQADGTAWMAMYCQNMLEIAVELALHDPVYEKHAIKFYEHFLWIAHAMQESGPMENGLWDEQDGFFYDQLCFPDGKITKIKINSIEGLIALCANSIFPADVFERLPNFAARIEEFRKQHPELTANIYMLEKPGVNGQFLISLLDEKKLKRILSQMLDENLFLSPYGIRSLSRYYADHPYTIEIDGRRLTINYEPAESTTGDFGGNSNWRGPIWFPINLLIIRALLNLYRYFGDGLKIECPTGSGKQLTLYEVSKEIAARLLKIFLRNPNGERPVYGGTKKFQTDPYWRDNILFYEYFHGDNGAGLGASHQTGWTGTIAVLMKFFAEVSSDDLLSANKKKELEQIIDPETIP